MENVTDGRTESARELVAMEEGATPYLATSYCAFDIQQNDLDTRCQGTLGSRWHMQGRLLVGKCGS